MASVSVKRAVLRVPKVDIRSMKEATGLTWKEYAEVLELSQREMMRYAARTKPKTLPRWLRLAVMAFDEYVVGTGT